MRFFDSFLRHSFARQVYPTSTASSSFLPTFLKFSFCVALLFSPVPCERQLAIAMPCERWLVIAMPCERWLVIAT